MTDTTNTHTTPVPARTDVRPAPTRRPAARRPFVREGMLLSAGALAWAVSMAVGGIDPGDTGADRVVFSLCSGLFQLGLLALLTVLSRTQALGTGRLARFFVRVEAVLVTLALASTTADGLGVSDLDQVGWALLDAFWPLSMLGMFLIGIRIAIAGRWRGASRFWPMVAESWAVVVIPVMGVFGDTAAHVVAPLHLIVGYVVLGQLVARKEA
jgi:hypothetical protein